MTDEIRRLRERQAEIATQARTLLDQVTDDTPQARAEEIEREFDTMMDDHDGIGTRIERSERLANAEARMNDPDPRRPRGDDDEARGGGGDDAPTYDGVFVRAVQYGVAELSPEERGVLRAGREDTPRELRAQSSTTDAAGAYTVPEGFSGQLSERMVAWGPMWDADIVRELNTASGNRIPWPTDDDTAQTGEDHAENAAATDDGSGDLAFGERQLDAYVHDTKVVRVPIELLQDSAFDMEDLLADRFGKRLGRRANASLTTGTGNGQPHGIVTASSLGHTAVSNAAIAADELFDLQHSVDPAYRASPKVRWMFNDDTLKAVRKLKDGQGNYLWQLGDIRSGEPQRILEKPFSVNQAMAGIGALAKPVIFGDLNEYIVRKVINFQLLTLRERYAERFQVGMIAFRRFDGELLDTTAVKHLVHPA